jgi:hypothetical protein
MVADLAIVAARLDEADIKSVAGRTEAGEHVVA